MSNPYFNNDPYFGDSQKAQQGRRAMAGSPSAPGTSTPSPWGTPGATQTYQPPSPVPSAQDNLEASYRMPSAAPADTGRMTYDDVIVKTSIVLGTIVLFGAAAWVLPGALGMPGLTFPLMIVGAIGGFVLGLVNAFKREPKPGLILAYAALEGLFLGAISMVFEAQYSGIVMQAVLATVSTFAAVLLLFRSGKVRNTPKFQRIVMVALVGYLVFSVVNLLLMVTGVLDGWGLREGPWGVLIGVAAVLLAAAMLVIDFDTIQKGVQRGAPARYAWGAAFGLAVTLVWMYLEFLRLLAILRGD